MEVELLADWLVELGFMGVDCARLRRLSLRCGLSTIVEMATLVEVAIGGDKTTDEPEARDVFDLLDFRSRPSGKLSADAPQLVK